MRRIVISVQSDPMYSHRQRISIYPSRYNTVSEFLDIIGMELKHADGSPMILPYNTRLSLMDPQTSTYSLLKDDMLPLIKDRSKIRIERSHGLVGKVEDEAFAAEEAKKNDPIKLDPVMKCLFEYHAKITTFLSSRVAAETDIAAKELAVAEHSHAASARHLVGQLTHMDPMNGLKVLTQLCVKEGKGEREFTEEESVRELKGVIATSKERIKRLEGELNNALKLAELLQGQIHTNASEKEEEMLRLKQEVVALRRLSHEQQVDMISLQKSCANLQRENGHLRTLQEAAALQVKEHIGRGRQLAVEDRPSTAPHTKVIRGLKVNVSGGGIRPGRSPKADSLKPGPGFGGGVSPKNGKSPRHSGGKSPKGGRFFSRSPREGRSPSRSPKRAPIENMQNDMKKLILDEPHSGNLVRKSNNSGFSDTSETSGDDASPAPSPVVAPTPLTVATSGAAARPATAQPSHVPASPTGLITPSSALRPSSSLPTSGKRVSISDLPSTNKDVSIQFVDQDGDFFSTSMKYSLKQTPSLHILFEEVVKSLLEVKVRPLSCRHLKMSYFRFGSRYIMNTDETVAEFFNTDGKLAINCIEQLEKEPIANLDSLIGAASTNSRPIGRRQSFSRRGSTTSALSGVSSSGVFGERAGSFRHSITASSFEMGMDETESEATSFDDDERRLSPWGSKKNLRPGLGSSKELRKKKAAGVFEPTPSSALFSRGSGASLPSDHEMEQVFQKLGGSVEEKDTGLVPASKVVEHLKTTCDDMGDPGRFQRLVAPYTRKSVGEAMVSYEQLCLVLLKMAKE